LTGPRLKSEPIEDRQDERNERLRTLGGKLRDLGRLVWPRRGKGGTAGEPGGPFI